MSSTSSVPHLGAAHETVTVFHVANLHCISCIQTIEKALSTLVPPPQIVVAAIAARSVSVHHSLALSTDHIRDAISNAGFDISHRDSSLSPIQSTCSTIVNDKHLQQCTLCQQQGNLPPEKTLVLEDSPSFQALFSVSGMTCSACMNSITRALEDISGVSYPVVNLLDNSVTVVIDREDLTSSVQEMIEDCGFEADLIEVISLSPSASPESSVQPLSRTVTLQVLGMYCSHCPGRVTANLNRLGSSVTVTKPFDNFSDPLITLSYVPDPPMFTIRQIIDAITSQSPGFNVKVYHPPSVEERSQTIRLHEQRRLLIRFGITAILAIPTFILGIVYMSLVKVHNPVKMYLMQPMWVGNASRLQWALFILATPAMFYSAGLFHQKSAKEIHALWKRGSTVSIADRLTRFGSMNLLVSAGVSVAYFASIVLLGLAAAQPPAMNGMGDSATYFDSVVLLTMFILIGRYLEAYSKSRTADAITALASLRPAEALVVVPTSSSNSTNPLSSVVLGATLQDSDLEKADSASVAASYSVAPGRKVEKVLVDLLEVGDIVRVLHGSTPPADGTIVSGEHSLFDESSLTGESRPVKKSAGDQVFLGTINKGNVVHVKVAETGGQTMLNKIMKVVREGQAKRAPMERIADIITSYFVPVITLLALLTWIIWLSLGLSGKLPADYLDAEIGGWPVWSLEFAIAVFVIACPCGIALAAPTAMLVGSGLAAKHGILVRGGGEAFQEASRINTIVFDKTGTLTAGELEVTNELFCAQDLWKDKIILNLVREMESNSSHPLASALHKYCLEKSPSPSISVSGSVDETPGRGLKATFADPQCTMIIGNEAWMRDHAVVITEELLPRIDRWNAEAKSTVFTAVTTRDEEYRLVAIFVITDRIRKEASALVAWFKSRGITPWMVSGDRLKTALAVATQVGISPENVVAEVLPQEKGEKIEWLQRAGPNSSSGKGGRQIVAMVGDGINDSVALSLADVGIAIGSGSDVAVSSASFILLSSDLRGLLTLVDLSKNVIRRVKFNFVWALLYNIAALPIAAGVLYPVGHIRLDPVWAALAMCLSSVSVVCSSLLLRLYRVPKSAKE
ncbi:heavy metal translocatin [Marasmius fiardii PR-910]|nr:heavy metal translocatin [Marasmius fiardii PR-910]